MENASMQADKKTAELVKVKIEFTVIKPVKQTQLDEDMGGYNRYVNSSDDNVETKSKPKEIVSNKEISKEVHFYLDKNGNYFEDPYDYYYSLDKGVYDDVTEGNAHGAVELYDKMFVYQFYLDRFPNYKDLHKIGKTMAEAVSEIDMAFDIENGEDIIQETLNASVEEAYGVEMKNHDDDDYRKKIHEHFNKKK